MGRQLITIIVGLGVFVLLIGLVITPTMTASNEDASRGFELAEGDNATVTDGLQMEVEAVDSQNTTANVTLQDTESRLSETNQIGEGNTSNYTVAGENATVTLDEVRADNTTRTTVEYSRTYGWGDGAKLMAGRFDVLLGIIGFLMVIGSLGAVTNQ